MGRNILWTFGTKALSGIINLFIIILTTQFLGAEGKGEIGIFVLNLVVILMLSDVVGGAGLVYVIPRSDVFKVAVSSYCWALFSSVFFTAVFYLFQFTNEKYLVHLFFLSILLNFTTVNTNILLGKEKIKESNILIVLQIVVQLLLFIILLFVFDKKEVNSFFLSLYGSYLAILFSGWMYIKKQINSTTVDGLFIEVKKMFGYGIFVQAGNFLQLMNYRLSYYLLEHYHGVALVGVYSTGTSLCEAVWIISNSISRVQYAHIANTGDKAYAQLLSVRLSKISLLATVAALIPMLLFPVRFYLFVFGTEFESIKTVLFTLFFGIASFGLTAMYSHYFSGTGKVRISTFASFIGFLFTLPIGFIIIPRYGLAGAGITSTVSYLATSIFLTYYFLKETQTNVAQLIPSLQDFRIFVTEIIKLNPK